MWRWCPFKSKRFMASVEWRDWIVNTCRIDIYFLIFFQKWFLCVPATPKWNRDWLCQAHSGGRFFFRAGPSLLSSSFICLSFSSDFFFLLLLEQHRQPPSAPPQQQQQQQPTTKKTFSETRSQRGDLERNPISPLICLCVSSSSSAASLNTVDDDFSTFYLFLLLKGSRNELCPSRINVLNSVLVCPFRKWRKTLSCGWNLIFMDDVSVGLYGRPATMGAMQISLSRLWVAWAKRPVIADVVQQTIFSFLFSKCFIGFRPIV